MSPHHLSPQPTGQATEHRRGLPPQNRHNSKRISNPKLSRAFSDKLESSCTRIKQFSGSMPGFDRGKLETCLRCHVLGICNTRCVHRISCCVMRRNDWSSLMRCAREDNRLMSNQLNRRDIPLAKG